MSYIEKYVDPAACEFIVASSRAWHKEKFDAVVLDLPGRWTYVTTRDELMHSLLDKSPRYVFFLHWNWQVPEDILEQHECVCFHMTDVPYGRGGSPLQNLIQAGHSSTKLSALRMVRDMDAGPVYTKLEMTLNGRAIDIYKRAGALSWDVIKWMIESQPRPCPQAGKPTFFSRRVPAQSVLPEEGGLGNIFDHIRMLDAPDYPLAFIDYGEFRIEFMSACLVNGEIHAKSVIKMKSQDGKS